MKILIDISHPAHVHFFKYAYHAWKEHGHQIKVVSRDKDITLQLLREYGIPNQVLSKVRTGFWGLSLELLQHASKLFGVARKFKPDVMLNIGGAFIVHVGKLLGIKTVVFYDTEHAKISNTITYPFASYICTPSCYLFDLGKKHVRYEGYQELAYLHPDYFKPNPSVLEEAGISPDEKFFVVRFISWASSHDMGQAGFSYEDKLRLVTELAKEGRVIITSESPLPAALEPFRLSISPTKMHDLLYYAHLYIGESATMASESAILGTPSIHVNTTPAYGYIKELVEKYGLVYRFVHSEQAIAKALAIAADSDYQAGKTAQHQQLLLDKIDVTAWVVEFVESLG